MLRETAERIDAAGGSPFRASVELGLRTTPIMRDWLREQIDATD
jgi:hypothetical protein